MGQTKTVPVYCNQCVAGPDLLKVEVEDGVATRVTPNFDIAAEHPGAGRVCVKAFGLIQKTYNPHRVRQPMVRTNPRKGRDEDPGFEPVSWEVALDLVAEKLRAIRDKGLRDELGLPRLAVSFGQAGTPARYMGTFPAFLSAWGPADLGFGSGQGVKCFHSEHLYGELWHRAFTVTIDTPRCDYLINCGSNIDASAGVSGVRRQADARVRGFKRIQVEPHLSVTGASATEWVPIKPKTDAAFLFGVIHRIVHERRWDQVCDVRFLAHDTNSPYLIGPHGYYLRDPESEKPLLWDADRAAAVPFDAGVVNPALTGTYRGDGLEIGADDERWAVSAVPVTTAFDTLREHLRRYTPEWAEGVCDVPASTIRRIADEFVAHARVGETIEIDGQTFPLRPVGVMLGKSVNNGWGGYAADWARTVLTSLVGALEVPGATMGTKVRLNRPADNRLKSVRPMADGFMDYPFNDTSRSSWKGQPHIRNAYRMLVPLAADSPWSAALGPAHLPWLFQKSPPDPWPGQSKPEVWICYRTNPAISSWAGPEVAERIAEFPFTVAFAYTRDETNHMADVLLPEATDLESYQLSRIGGTGAGEQFWTHRGWAVRQPVADPVVDTRDMTEVGAELCQRLGLLEAYNEAVNRGAGGIALRTDAYDYSLDTGVLHDAESVWDAAARAASHELSGGTEVHGLEWFKQHGYMLRPFPQSQWYLYPALKAQGLRFELPYQERLRRHGTQLAARLHQAGIGWWDKQLAEYEALPSYQDYPDIWTEYAREVGRDPAEFPFWALTARSMQYSWGANAGLPIIAEVARNVTGHRGVILNRGAGSALGISSGDLLVLESAAGKTRARAVLRDGVRPDTCVLIGQFDHWVTPVAKDLAMGSLNSLTPLALSLTDSTGSGADLVRVKISKAEP